MQKIKDFYDAGLWTAGMVANAVVKGRITEAEYQEITGDTYTAPAVQPESGLQEQIDSLTTVLNEVLFSVLPGLES